MTVERSTPSATVAPTAPGQRYELIDIVRGFALFGVLLANMIWVVHWFALSDEQRGALPTPALDSAVSTLATLLVDYKFYTLFSMLFGLGFALQLGRGAERGQPVIPTYVRRLAILLALGAAHALLLWFGDILHIYAVLGFVLIPFHRLSDRAVLHWMIGIVGLILLMPLVTWLTSGATAGDEAGAEGARQAAYLAAMQSGSWREIIELNWTVVRNDYTHLNLRPDGSVHWYLSVLWKFLLGFYLGRRALLQRSGEYLGSVRRILPWALTVGLLGNLIMTGAPWVLDVWIPSESSAVLLLWLPVEFGIPALSLAYVCCLILLYHRPRGRRLVQPLAPLGRMALTNYLTQSVLLVAIFYGVGFGFLGKIGAAGCLLLSLVIYAAQLAFSAWWLRRFRFGPAEWMWRSLTYGRWQTMRVDPRGPSS